ncbi:MAG: HEPN domain-containing protein [Planctomycetota bacterium]|nr:HEPN domain-containing protein [Planctomycetota bacterium]
MVDFQGESRRWLEQARRDLDDARFCAGGNRYNLACFLCQQAAEKALKAYLYAQGNPVVWGHSVDELCRQSATTDPDFDDLRTRVRKLDRFYIPTRYPNGLPGGLPADSFDETDATQALDLTQETIEFVEAHLAS